MASLLRFAPRRRIEEEASLWIVRLDRGLTPELRDEIGRWLAADPRHGTTLVRMATLWDGLEVMSELSELFPLPPPRRQWPRVSFVGGAAAVGVAVAIVGVTLFASRVDWTRGVPLNANDAPVTTVSATPQPVRLSTVVGEQRTEWLADGSVLQLNTATELRVELEPSERRIVLLRGEASFDVRSDPARPFVVWAGGHRLRAVGTAFNVLLRENDRVEIVVTEGRVVVADLARVDSDTPALEVSAGESAVVGSSGRSVKRNAPVEANPRLAWQRGMLVFDGEPLASALGEVERYTDLRFELRDPELTELRVGGYYRIGDIDALLRSLEQNFSVRVIRSGQRVIIEPAE